MAVTVPSSCCAVPPANRRARCSRMPAPSTCVPPPRSHRHLIGSPRSYPAPAPVLMEKPRLADPASLGDGRGGEVPEVRQGTHAPQPPSPQRYAVRLVEGSSEAFMRALIGRHPGLSLRLRRELRDGQELFAVERGDYLDPEQARRALAELPESLPRGKARVIAHTPGSAL